MFLRYFHFLFLNFSVYAISDQDLLGSIDTNRALASNLIRVISGNSFSTDQEREKYDGLFKIKFEEQKEIYDNYLDTIQLVKNGEKNIVFDSHVDMDSCRKYNQFKSHRVFVIDVGGSFLKLGSVTLSPSLSKNGQKGYNSDVVLKEYEYKPLLNGIPLEKQNWYDWVASVLLEKKGELEECLENVSSAVLTFSYAMNQSSLDKAQIHSVAKNWKFHKPSNFHDECIVGCLNIALKKNGFNFEVNSAMNDSIATYMAGIMQSRASSQIGIIIGTGMNAAYELNINGKNMLINSELAKTQISKAIFTVSDAKELLKLQFSKSPHNELELLTAGHKFVEIVKNQLERSSNIAKTKFSKALINLTLEEIIKILRIEEENLDEVSREIKYTVIAFKRRAAKVLAPLLCAISHELPVKNINLIMNGSIAKHPLDQLLLIYELDQFSSKMNLDFKFKCVTVPCGSVDGAAFVSMVRANSASKN